MPLLARATSAPDAGFARRDGRVAARLGLLAAVAGSWVWLLAACLFAAMGATVLARYPTGQDSDGLLQTIMPLQHLTLFFWGQDRFANLLPFLTAWIGDPGINALVQLALRIACGLLAPLFFCMLVCPRERAAAWSATLLASGLLLAWAPHDTVFEALIQASPYGTSFALAGLCLVALGAAGRAHHGAARAALRGLGLVLACAAYAVNASLVLIAAPLVAGEVVLFGSVLAMDFAFASLLACVVAATLSTLGAGGAPATALGFGASTDGLAFYAGRMLAKPGFFLWAMAAAGFAALGLLRVSRRDAEAGRQLGRAGLLTATFAVSFLAVALSDWVALNVMHARYLVPEYFLAASLGGMAAVQVVRRALRRPQARAAAVLAASACLLLVAMHRTRAGEAGHGGMIAASRRPAAEIVAAAVTERSLDAVGGDFWAVWPAVFRAEQMAHDLGRPAGRVFGITYRGDARRDAFVARLLARGRLDIACIGNPAWCNAQMLLTMTPPDVRSVFGNEQIRLPDGEELSFFTVELAGR